MKNDRLYADHILKNIASIERLTADGKVSFLTREDDQAAVLYYLQTLAESSIRLSETQKATRPEIEWNKIKGFRNIVVHQYLDVDLEMVWSIIEQDLPMLKTAIEAIQHSLENREAT